MKSVTSLQAEKLLLLTLIMAGSLFGQVSMLPELLNIGAPLGSTTPATQAITLFTPGQNLNFDVSVRYLSPTTGWLSASPLQGTSPAQITIAANPSNLAQGTYVAQVVASVGPLHLGAWTTVSFTIAPSGSNGGGLAVTPTSLTFLGSSSTDPQTLTVANAPGTTGVLHFTASASSSGWLQISQSDSVTPGNVTLRAYPGSLAAGIHTGAVTITATETGKSTIVPASLVISGSSPGQPPTLTPAQQAITFGYQLNSDAFPVQGIFVGTNSTNYVQFTATSNASWLGVASATYLSPAATAVASAPGLFYATLDARGLSAGTYSTTITLTSPNIAPVDIPVNLTVSTTPVFNADPSFISLSTEQSLLSSNFAITASETVDFNVTVGAGASWLSVTPVSGQAAADPINLTVTANPTGLTAGTYTSAITLTATGGRPNITIPVQFKVSGTGAGTSLAVSPASLGFSAFAGDPDPGQYLNVFSSSTASQQFTAAAVSDGGWLNITPTSGSTPTWPKVSVNTAIAAGSYTGSILVTSLTTGNQVSIPVSYKLSAKTFTATPTTLDFAQPAGGGTIALQQIQVAATPPSTIRIVSQPKWIKIQAPASLMTPVKLVVSADPTGLPSGTYQDAILLSGPADLRVPVSLTIPDPPPPPPPTVSPTAITFSYGLGSPVPDAQMIQVASPNGTATFTAAASTDSGVNWLQVTPTSGSTPGSITVNIMPGLLTPGKQTGSIVIAVQDLVPKSFTVPVTLTVSGSAIQVREVWNAATSAPTSAAPGEIVTITGIGLGPTTAAVARASSAGAFGTQLGGMSVLFDDIPAPILYAQYEQINAIVPYGVYGRTSTRLQVQSASDYSVPIDVKVVDAAPGIYTSGKTGRGQAAASNGDGSANSVLNPADRGTVIALYLTGEGQTDPPGQDGRVIATDLHTPLLPVTATIGGRRADVLYAGSAPGQVSGMCQVNLRIPADLEPGTQTVEVQVGGIATQRAITIVVR